MPALREWRDRALDRSRWSGALYVLSVWELLGHLGAPGAKANTATPDASARRVLLEQGLAMPTLPIAQVAEFVLVVAVFALIAYGLCRITEHITADPRLELAPDDDDEFKRPIALALHRWTRDIPGGEVMQDSRIGESVGQYVRRIIETECPPDLLAEGEIETTAGSLGGLHIVVERHVIR